MSVFKLTVTIKLPSASQITYVSPEWPQCLFISQVSVLILKLQVTRTGMISPLHCTCVG